MRIDRLKQQQTAQAKALFGLLSEVLGEGEAVVSEAYIDRLLQQDTFWAVAAFDGDSVVGGLTAHVLPMTRADYSDLLIYDVAAREDRRRQGIGQVLVNWVIREASALGIHSVFVLANNEDVDAIRFYRKLKGAISPVTLIAWS